MKHLSLLTAFLGVFFTGCAQQNTMSHGDIVELEYTRSGSMAGYEYEAHVTRDSTGSTVLEAMPQNYTELRKRTLSREELDTLRDIVIAEKMLSYKEHYTPLLHVLDGYSWTLTISFSDGKRVHSTGSNAGPHGNGIQRLTDYLKQLARKD